MNTKRQSGRALPDYDRKAGFAAPDRRRGGLRTAAHRYIASSAGAPSADASDAYEFRARWWPAPDAWQ